MGVHIWGSKLVPCWDRSRVWKKISLLVQTSYGHDNKETCTPVLAVLDTRSAKDVAEFWLGISA